LKNFTILMLKIIL